MIEELIDKMIDEKMDHKEYMELSEEIDDMEVKQMFMKMSQDEENHYKMLREYMERLMNK